MKLNRREFLTLSGKSAAGAVLFAACSIPEKEHQKEDKNWNVYGGSVDPRDC